MGSPYLIFVKAERIEQLAAETYRAVAEAFPDAPVAPLLLRLAVEEEQHGARVRLLATRYRHAPRLFANVDFKLHALDELMAEGEQLKKEIVEGHWRGRLEALMERLVALEGAGALSHAHVLADGADPAVAQFFRQLSEQDQAHIALIAQARK